MSLSCGEGPLLYFLFGVFWYVFFACKALTTMGGGVGGSGGMIGSHHEVYTCGDLDALILCLSMWHVTQAGRFAAKLVAGFTTWKKGSSLEWTGRYVTVGCGPFDYEGFHCFFPLLWSFAEVNKVISFVPEIVCWVVDSKIRFEDVISKNIGKYEIRALVPIELPIWTIEFVLTRG